MARRPGQGRGAGVGAGAGSELQFKNSIFHTLSRLKIFVEVATYIAQVAGTWSETKKCFLVDLF